VRINQVAPIAAAVLLVAACSSSTMGKPTIDVEHAKITSTVKVNAPESAGGLTVLSPDGRHVLGTDNGKVCVFDPDGTHNVCADVDADIAYASWSPDSTRVAFTDDYYRKLREPDIWVMDAGTGKASDLTDDGVAKVSLQHPSDPDSHLDLLPSWSADGKTVRFVRAAGSDGITIESVPAGGGQVTELGRIGGVFNRLAGLAFSPDGKTVAWSYGENAGWTSTTVHVRGVGGGDDHALAPQKSDQSLLSFSPDGRYLLVDSRQTYAQYSCCAASSARVYGDGGRGDARPVAPNVVAVYPGWAPSGHALAFLTPQPHPSIQLLAEPGGQPRTLKTADHLGTPNGTRLQWTSAGLFVFEGPGAAIYHLG
jgi:WD40 repeat protein